MSTDTASPLRYDGKRVIVSYITGENLTVDGGTLAAVTAGRLVLEFHPERLHHPA
jgi:hypothetical protein